jgi:hypothetical protein
MCCLPRRGIFFSTHSEFETAELAFYLDGNVVQEDLRDEEVAD